MTDVQNNQAPPSVQELKDVIEEFEQYRERLLGDSLDTAKRAKMRKADIMAQIEPELNKIDSALEQLRAQLAAAE
ncbi:MAG: hypothetical protein HC810_00085 [Acaryochloridaceae cyanobacterium RL_2_7]|nr:hypothetical protein [Acaryochloridaceae cyanobacterium RL_2_7]